MFLGVEKVVSVLAMVGMKRKMFLFFALLGTLSLQAVESGLWLFNNDACTFQTKRISLSANMPEEFPQKFWKGIEADVAKGKKVLVQVMLAREDKKRIPSFDFAKPQLEPVFKSEFAKPELLYGVVMNEENVYWDKQEARLNQIYDYLHNECNVKCFQWLSEPLPPSLTMKADGWVFDAYSIKTPQFYIHCEKFILTGLPVVAVVWGAGHFDKYFPKKNFEELTDFAITRGNICASMGMPVVFFGVTINPPGSVNAWWGNKDTDEDERKYRETIKEYIINLPKEETFDVTPTAKSIDLNAGLNLTNKQIYNFNNFNVANVTTFDSASNWVVTKDGMVLKGEKGTLSWFVNQNDSIKELDMVLNYQLEGNASLFVGDKEFKLDAKLNTFKSSGLDLINNKIELVADGKLTLKELEFNFTVERKLTPIQLVDGKYTETFKDQQFISSLRPNEFPEQLVATPNGVIMRGRNGSAVKATLVQEVQVPENATTLNVRAFVTEERSNFAAGLKMKVNGVDAKPEKTNVKRLVSVEAPVEGGTIALIEWELFVNCGKATPKATPVRIEKYTIEAK